MALVLAVPLAATAVPADAASTTGRVADGDPTRIATASTGQSAEDGPDADGADEDSTAGDDEMEAGGDRGSGDRKVGHRPGDKAAPRLPRAGEGEVQGKARWYAMTWQSNELPSRDDAIYHCVRAGYIVGRAHIVARGEASRFSCRYDKKTDWPYGVKVFQPAGRRVVVKVGTKVVRDYDPPSTGRDVWVVEGNPTGWWRTYIT